MNESAECHSIKARAVAEITTGDLVLRRVSGEPAFAVREQFFDFVVADEVVFARIEHRDQNVEVAEQFRKRNDPTNRHREVWAIAPFGELFIQRVTDGFEFVPERTLLRRIGREGGEVDS